MIVPVVIFAIATAAGIHWGRPALRGVAVMAIVLVPLRGGLLALADDLPFAASDLAVNAIVPALVAAVIVGVAVRLRPDPRSLPRPLAGGWLLIAVCSLLSLCTAAVSLKLFGVGLAQYLVYPAFGLAVLPLLGPGDERRLVWLIVALGAFVSLTAIVQAAGIEDFIQAASAEVEGFEANRYAGVTGSYLHTSAFLGVVAVLAMGLVAESPSKPALLGGLLILSLLLSGIVLTFSRSGIIIAGIGAAALAVSAIRRGQLRSGAAIAIAVVAALGVGTASGVSPVEMVERVTSLLGGDADKGNSQRFASFEAGVDSYRNAEPDQKLFGQGLGATGNASQLVDEQALIVESYYLKLLVETGAVGVILIGGYLALIAFCFGYLALRGREPWLVAVGAAGLGLSLYNLIYPALETQILALTWWLIAMVCILQVFVHAEPPGFLGFLRSPAALPREEQ